MPLVCVSGPGSRLYASGSGGDIPGEFFDLTPDVYVDPAKTSNGDGTLGNPYQWSQISGAGALSAGDVVGLLAGTGTLSGSGHALTPRWQIQSSGSSGNPIRLVAQWPAAYYSTNRTELRNGVTGSGNSGACPTFGSNGEAGGGDYIEWIGFYVNEAASGGPTGTGPVCINNADGIVIRACHIVGEVWNSGDNHCGVWVQYTNNSAVYNCEIENFRLTTNHSSWSNNYAGIITYDANTFTAEHNYVHHCDIGFFPKGDHEGTPPVQNTHNYRYNWIEDCDVGGFRVITLNKESAATDSLLEHNFIRRCGHSIWFADTGGLHQNDVKFRYNTIVECGDNAYITFGFGSPVTTILINQNGVSAMAQCDVSRNLYVDCPKVIELYSIQDADLATLISNGFTCDNNHAHGFTNWGTQVQTNSTLSAWQSNTGLDTNSTTGDPDFVDEENDDYHPQNSDALTKGMYANGQTNAQIGIEGRHLGLTV